MEGPDGIDFKAGYRMKQWEIRRSKWGYVLKGWKIFRHTSVLGDFIFNKTDSLNSKLEHVTRQNLGIKQQMFTRVWVVEVPCQSKGTYKAT